MRRRTAHAARLWHAGRFARIVACGGVLHSPVTEASVMRALLIAAGVPDAAIACEDASRNTAQNIRLARAFLTPGEPVVIVTDRYHMPRALMIARAEGLAATGAPAPRGDGRTLTYAFATLREGPAILKWLILRR
jgi:uncharacterized SAM-binding protein YcdF (DUF218 family)